MRLSTSACWERAGSCRRAVLATVHPQRGVDMVPVVFALLPAAGSHRIVIPIDTVKAKTGSGALQRVTNLELDARCSVLFDSYDDDWSQLWWVRAHGRGVVRPAPAAAHSSDSALVALAARHPQYAPAGSIAATVDITVESIGGWSAR